MKTLVAAAILLSAAVVLRGQTTKFAVIGDFGLAGVNEAAVSAMVHLWDVDFILTTGDNNYETGSSSTIDANIGQYYYDFIAPYSGAYGSGSASGNQFFPSLGNHDWGTGNVQAHLDYFSLPGNERYYDFVRGPVHFFALDSDSHEPDGTSSVSAQAAWLQAAMAGATEPWKVVYFHHPPYSSSSSHGSTPGMQWPFKEWGADAVLAGHDHTYERLAVDGLSYFVNGLGGKSKYDFGTPLPESQFQYNADYGAMLVTAAMSSITFEFYAVDGGDGTLVDRFVLVPEPAETASLMALALLSLTVWRRSRRNASVRRG